MFDNWLVSSTPESFSVFVSKIRPGDQYILGEQINGIITVKVLNVPSEVDFITVGEKVKGQKTNIPWFIRPWPGVLAGPYTTGEGVTLEEAAKMAGVKTGAIKHQAQKGALPAYRPRKETKGSRPLMFNKDDLKIFLENRH
jgi:hypothetical protein